MSSPSGVRACPACQRVASSGRRFCGGCRAILVRACGVCGFGNELDDCWCGGCGRAVPVRAATVHDGPVRAHQPVTPSEPRSGESRAPVSPIKPRTPAVQGASAAAMLAINRRRGEPSATAKNDDVQDQAQLDALFGGQ